MQNCFLQQKQPKSQKATFNRSNWHKINVMANKRNSGVSRGTKNKFLKYYNMSAEINDEISNFRKDLYALLSEMFLRRFENPDYNNDTNLIFSVYGITMKTIHSLLPDDIKEEFIINYVVIYDEINIQDFEYM
jgi:hypothetical protein